MKTFVFSSVCLLLLVTEYSSLANTKEIRLSNLPGDSLQGNPMLSFLSSIMNQNSKPHMIEEISFNPIQKESIPSRSVKLQAKMPLNQLKNEKMSGNDFQMDGLDDLLKGFTNEVHQLDPNNNSTDEAEILPHEIEFTMPEGSSRNSFEQEDHYPQQMEIVNPLQGLELQTGEKIQHDVDPNEIEFIMPVQKVHHPQILQEEESPLNNHEIPMIMGQHDEDIPDQLIRDIMSKANTNQMPGFKEEAMPSGIMEDLFKGSMGPIHSIPEHSDEDLPSEVVGDLLKHNKQEFNQLSGDENIPPQILEGLFSQNNNRVSHGPQDHDEDLPPQFMRQFLPEKDNRLPQILRPEHMDEHLNGSPGPDFLRGIFGQQHEDVPLNYPSEMELNPGNFQGLPDIHVETLPHEFNDHQNLHHETTHTVHTNPLTGDEHHEIESNTLHHQKTSFVKRGNPFKVLVDGLFNLMGGHGAHENQPIVHPMMGHQRGPVFSNVNSHGLDPNNPMSILKNLFHNGGLSHSPEEVSDVSHDSLEHIIEGLKEHPQNHETVIPIMEINPALHDMSEGDEMLYHSGVHDESELSNDKIDHPGNDIIHIIGPLSHSNKHREALPLIRLSKVSKINSQLPLSSHDVVSHHENAMNIALHQIAKSESPTSSPHVFDEISVLKDHLHSKTPQDLAREHAINALFHHMSFNKDKVITPRKRSPYLEANQYPLMGENYSMFKKERPFINKNIIASSQKTPKLFNDVEDLMVHLDGKKHTPEYTQKHQVIVHHSPKMQTKKISFGAEEGNPVDNFLIDIMNKTGKRQKLSSPDNSSDMNFYNALIDDSKSEDLDSQEVQDINFIKTGNREITKPVSQIQNMDQHISVFSKQRIKNLIPMVDHDDELETLFSGKRPQDVLHNQVNSRTKIQQIPQSIMVVPTIQKRKSTRSHINSVDLNNLLNSLKHNSHSSKRHHKKRSYRTKIHTTIMPIFQVNHHHYHFSGGNRRNRHHRTHHRHHKSKKVEKCNSKQSSKIIKKKTNKIVNIENIVHHIYRKPNHRQKINIKVRVKPLIGDYKNEGPCEDGCEDQVEKDLELILGKGHVEPQIQENQDSHSLENNTILQDHIDLKKDRKLYEKTDKPAFYNKSSADERRKSLMEFRNAIKNVPISNPNK